MNEFRLSSSIVGLSKLWSFFSDEVAHVMEVLAPFHRSPIVRNVFVHADGTTNYFNEL